MQFGTMNEYRPIQGRRWLGLPYRVNYARISKCRAFAIACVVVVVAAMTMFA